MSQHHPQFQADARGVSVAIVVARFNDEVTAKLLAGAEEALRRAEAAQVDVYHVPGAFELPFAAARLVEDYDCIVALGCVIRGATPHFDYVAGEAAKGVAAVAHDSGVPVAFGVLTVDTIEQAIERAGTKAGNKGAEAMLCAIETVNLARAIEEA